jgi:hypothetical protein
MIPMFSQQTLKAYGAQIIFAKGLDIFLPMNLAFRQVLVSERQDALRLRIHASEFNVQLVVRVVRHVTCGHIFHITLNSLADTT